MMSEKTQQNGKRKTNDIFSTIMAICLQKKWLILLET